MADSDLSRSVAEPVPVPTLVLSRHHRRPLSRWGVGRHWAAGRPTQHLGCQGCHPVKAATAPRYWATAHRHTGWGWGCGLAHTEPRGQAQTRACACGSPTTSLRTPHVDVSDTPSQQRPVAGTVSRTFPRASQPSCCHQAAAHARDLRATLLGTHTGWSL